MNEVCSGCAGWLEKKWSYCEQCGAPRSPQRRRSLKPFLSIYANERKHSGLGRAPAAAAYPLKERGNRALVRRRESAENVRRQLEHWGRKLNTQEHLLDSVERSNAVVRQAAASTAKIELHQAVHDGRKLVRHCSPGSKLSTSPTGSRQLRERRKLGARVSSDSNPTRHDYGKGSMRNTNSFLGDTTAVGRALRHGRNSMNTCSFVAPASSILSPIEGTKSNTTDKRLPKGLSVGVKTMLVEEECGANINSNSGCVAKLYQPQRAPAASTADSSGWFWGASGLTGNGDGVCGVPGEGAIGAFWGGMNLSVTPLDSASTPSPAVRISSPLNEERHRLSYQGCRPPSLTSIGVASAKSAVRSASNRAAELSYLLDEGHNAPREECLARVESAVRSAQGAISCSNERVFELELKAAAAEQVREQDASMGSGDAGIGSDPNTCIAELAGQLELAQSLLAASLAARARVTRRFAREDAAATLMQACVRGFHTRSRVTTAESISTKKVNILPLKSESPLVIDGDERVYGSSDASTVHPPGQAGSDQEEEEVETAAELPREEEEWWMPAKAENADEVGELETSLLRAVVKLQAIVRSRLARSRTIAAVNARFVEYFDEHYQAPFYVCAETESSQWNRPFGFSSSFDDYFLRHDATPVDCTAGHGEQLSNEIHASVLAQDEVPPNLIDEAAVVIQCAARSSQARALLAEKIVLASL